MSVAQPLFIWGLLGLAIPIAIHLLSRKEGKLVRIGSIRHIQESNTKQFKSIRLNELLLLILRCMLIVLIVLLMSGWQWNLFKDHKKWLIVENGLEQNSSLLTVFDSLQLGGFELHYLARGFPDADGHEVTDIETLDYQARIEELESIELDSAIIFSFNRVVGVPGKRGAIPSHVKWISIDPTDAEFSIRKVKVGDDSIYVRSASSKSDRTGFLTERKPISSYETGNEDFGAETPDTISIVVIYDEEFEQDARIVMALLGAIQQRIPDLIVLKKLTIANLNLTERYDWLFWLSNSSAPEIALNSIVFHPHKNGPLLDQQRSDKFFITARLNIEIAIKHNLALELSRALFPASKIWQQVAKQDVRSIDERIMWTRESAENKHQYASTVGDASSRYLLATIFLFVLIERLVSYRRGQ